MTLEDFVFNLPLYQEIDVNNGYNEIIDSLVKGDKTIMVDGYNSTRKKESTFFLEKGLCNLIERDNFNRNFFYSYYNVLQNEVSVKTIVFKCQRYYDTITIAVFHDPSKLVLIKVGQYPSVADIHIGQVKQYDKVLDKSILREFTKAIGLAANGVGIGSFVYLRRIFEKLVMDAYNEALQDWKVDAEQFEKQRMDEKIKSLKEFLPSFIVENSSIYGILSKAIHELTEEECLAYFDCMRKSIELILDEKLEILAKKKKQDEVKKTISSIASQIKK